MAFQTLLLEDAFLAPPPPASRQVRRRRQRREPAPLIVDYFAGCGGASTGIQLAVGRSPDLAINHCPHAVAVHELNHRTTDHLKVDVWDVDPRRHIPPGKVAFAWFSPDCTFFSRARGGKPVSRRVRGLAWIVLRVAAKRRPSVLALENVPEFRQWGPVRKRRSGKNKGNVMPVKSKKGQTFRKFVAQLEALGYVVDHRILNAADYGAPTSRKRLFLIARCDGEPIVWPEPSHGPGRLLPYRAASECIDWSLPCPSIFDRARPLSDKTMRRIARGLVRYVLDNPRPFVVPNNTNNVPHSTNEPLGTITTANRLYLCVPELVQVAPESTTAPFVVQTGHQSNDGGKARSVDEPLSTVVTKAEHCLVSPVLVHINHGRDQDRSRSVEEPLTTVTEKNGFGLMAPLLVRVGNGEREGQAPRVENIEAPLSTIVATGQKQALVVAWMAKHYGTRPGADGEAKAHAGSPVTEPLGTITAIDHHSLVACHLTKFYGSSTGEAGGDLDEPAPTVTAGGEHLGLVSAFLTKYYGADQNGQGVDEPLHTVVSKDRFALVTVTIDGQTYAIVDIGLRMLTPRELARCQGFADSFQMMGSKADQIARIGNSVPPPVVEAIVKSNLPKELRPVQEEV